jgi:DHA1 family multidrug/chloramphenicol efflux transport protein-like MFS transporter
MSESKKRLLVFSAFFVLYELVIYLSNDMIMPAMLQVVSGFHAADSNIALSLSLYILGGSSLQILLGPLADQIGKRKVMLAGNLLFLAATLAIPFASTMGQFLVARFFQGMGSCFIFIGYAVIHELFDDKEAVKLTTILSNTAIFAPLIGPVIGSAIVSQWQWQYVFIISLAVGCITFIGLFRTMPDGKIAQQAFDFATVRQSYARIFACRQFMLGIFIAGVAITPLTAWIGLSPAIVMESMKQSYASYIVCQCVVFSGFILATFAVQKFDENFSLGKLIRGGGALAAIGMSGFGLFHQNQWVFIAGMFVFSMGFGLFNGALIRLALTATGQSMNLTSSAMSLLYCIYISLGLEAYNLVCDTYGYTLASYAACNLPVGIGVYLGLLYFIKQHENSQSALAVQAASA